MPGLLRGRVSNTPQFMGITFPQEYLCVAFRQIQKIVDPRDVTACHEVLFKICAARMIIHNAPKCNNTKGLVPACVSISNPLCITPQQCPTPFASQHKSVFEKHYTKLPTVTALVAAQSKSSSRDTVAH